MTHLSENTDPLQVKTIFVSHQEDVISHTTNFNDVCLLILPPNVSLNLDKDGLEALFRSIGYSLGTEAILITLGEPQDLVHIHAGLSMLNYQLWIAIKRNTIKFTEVKNALPEHHFGALVHTRYEGSLKHAVTRIRYTYCPACDKTTKDYGGKKHTYNSFGTLISDIWRDIACDLEGDLTEVIHRFSDLFGIEMYRELRVLDCRDAWREDSHFAEKPANLYAVQPTLMRQDTPSDGNSRLIHGDSVENLRHLPDNSVDFAFIDPPYNLGKKYNNYVDDLSIKEYFLWCDTWISEIVRVLKPGRTLAILNIPLWAIRHSLFMETILEFQNWIAWDALSFPVRKIMPAHYAIACFTKGQSRPLPGLIGSSEKFDILTTSKVFQPLEPLAEGYCLRASCIRKRNAFGYTDRGPLTDLWGDIHRLKHNSRRVDHPCQLPPQLLYRLVSIFTEPNEVVLDCFNGAGTTTLAAHQLGRQYIGIELSEKYYRIAESRHLEIRQGLDPFRKVNRELTEKNSRVPRMPKQIYKIAKKTLQLEVRRVSKSLDRIPSRDDMIEYGQYPIRYYDDYFASWGEACAAARHDGMSEINKNETSAEKNHMQSTVTQLSLFDKGPTDAKR